MCVQDFTKDTMGISILIEMSHDNDIVVCHDINGQGK